MSTASDEFFLFVGPTAAGLDLCAFGVAGSSVLPPARRGDVHARIRDARAPGVLAIVDGTYHSHPAVGHMELRDALEAGWDVWGLSSMGAIRAYEMRALGMKGFGEIYAELFRHDDFQDDEVALLHSSEPPYLSISEPLVHIRSLLAQLVRDGDVAQDAAQRIIADLKVSWFGDRTLPRLCDLLERYATLGRRWSSAGVGRQMAGHRIKTRDLEDFLRARPWRQR